MITKIILLVVTGMVAGLTGGLLGIGGSIIMIPAMTELLGPDQHLYQAAAMIVTFFVVVPSAIQHFKAGAINLDMIRRLLPIGAVSVVLGVIISENAYFTGPGEARLRTLFGLFLTFICAYDIYRLFRKLPARASDAAPVHLSWRLAAVVAGPIGLVAGLLGVGGGVLAVPLQRRVLGIPLRTAIGNSATLIIATSFIGALVKNVALVRLHHRSPYESLILAGVLIPTAIVGASIGSRLTHRLPRRFVGGVFFVLMLVVSFRLTYSAIRDVPRAPRTQPHAGAGFALPFE